MTVVAAVFVALVMIGFGYLGSNGAVKKGYDRGLNWLLAAFFLLPTMIAIAFLPNRS